MCTIISHTFIHFSLIDAFNHDNKSNVVQLPNKYLVMEDLDLIPPSHLQVIHLLPVADVMIPCLQCH